jgi:hypothetical protein
MSFPPETSEPVLPESEAGPEEEEPASEGKIIAPVLRERPVTLDKVKSSPTIVTGLVILIIIALIFAFRSVSGFLGGPSASPTITKAPTQSTAPSAGSVATSGLATSPIVLPSQAGIQGSNKITFAPVSLDCKAPAAFVTTITLSSAFSATDVITENFNGQAVSSFVVGQIMDQLNDGSWTSANTVPVEQVTQICAAAGKHNGVAVFTVGTNDLKLLDGQGKLVAENSYKVK